MENINKNTVYALEVLTSAYRTGGMNEVEKTLAHWAKVAGETASECERIARECDPSDDSPMWELVSTAQTIEAEFTDHMADILKAFERIEFMGIKQAENTEQLNNWVA